MSLPSLRRYAGRPFIATAAFGLLLVSGCDRPQAATGTKPAAAAADRATPNVAIPVADASRSTTAGAETDAETLLYRALLYRNVGEVRRILDEHPDLANADLKGTKPLALASAGGLDLVRAVVEKGGQVNARAADNWSILFHAVQEGSVETVKYLILKGADPKAREVDGETLLWAAPTREMAEFLISRGVDPRARDNFNDTALHAACRLTRRDVVELLLNAGLHVETKGKWDMPPLHSAASSVTGDPGPVVRLLLQRGANVNSRGFSGHTAVHETAFYNRIEMLDLLLSHGADPNLKDAEGKTPMDLAHLAGADERVEVINLLIKNGAPGTLIKVQ